MALSIQIAKFKFHQYQLKELFRQILMLTKVTHYMVFNKFCAEFFFAFYGSSIAKSAYAVLIIRVSHPQFLIKFPIV